MRQVLLMHVILVAILANGIPDIVGAQEPVPASWPTEKFAQIATRYLEQWSGDLFRTNSSKSVSRLFDSSFEFRAPQETKVQTSHGFHFVSSDSSPSNSNRGGAEEFLEWIRNAWPVAETPRFEFKVISVQPTAKNVATDVLVAVTGLANFRGHAHPWEAHANWQIEWKPSDKGHPRISRLVVLREQSTFHIGTQRPLFVDRTIDVLDGMDCFHRQLAHGQPYWLRRIESFHGMLNPGQNGLAVGDLNNDGLDDVYVCQPGGLPNRVFVRTSGGGIIERSAELGLDLLDNSHSALIVDLDNDGDQDVVVCSISALLVFENRNRTFQLRFADRAMSDGYSLAANDFDQDGDLDFYACGYFPNGADTGSLPIPIPYYNAKNGGANRLYENRGDFQFRDITAEVGLDADNRRFSYSVLWIDIDNDGDDDLYVANDFGPDTVYVLDRSGESARFSNASESMGCLHGAFAMSVSAADINRDGFEDLYVANMFSSAGNRVVRQPEFRRQQHTKNTELFRRLANGNSLLLNEAGRHLTDIATGAGVAMGRWSWGSVFIDVNNDGWDDLLVTNGYLTGEQSDDL